MDNKIRDLKFHEVLYSHEWISEKNPIAVYRIIHFLGSYEKPYQIHILPYGIDGQQVINCYMAEFSSLEEAQGVINKSFKKHLADYLEKIKEEYYIPEKTNKRMTIPPGYFSPFA